MRCKGCETVLRQTNQGFTWRDYQLCPPCFMEKNRLKKVKINQIDRKYTVVYISKEMPVL